MIERIRRSLVLKAALVFLAAASIPFIAVSFFFFESSKQALHDEIVKGIETRAELMMDTIDSRIYLLRGNAIAWAGLDVMGDIVTNDIDKRITNILEGFKRDYRFSGSIYAINGRGEVVASSNPHSIGTQVSAEWLPRALSGELVELDMHASDIDSSTVISFIVPVRASFAEGSAVGVLVLESRLDDLKDMVDSGDIPIAGIFTRSGEPIAVSGDWPFDMGVFSGDGAGDTDALLAKPGYIVALERSKYYYDFRGFGWMVVAASSEAQALYPIRKVQRTSLILGAIGILWLFAFIWFFASRSLRPLKELSGTAALIARTKDFSSTVEYSSTDEIGRLADAFNHMVGEVRGHLKHIEDMEGEMRLADRLSAVGELSAGMAHEIRNPLGMIKSSADMLRKKHGPGDPERALSDVISEEAERLARILDAFLQFARPSTPRIERCNVNDVLTRAVSLLAPELKKGEVRFDEKFDPALPGVETDPDQLYQVFINLMINALHAMGSGGTLTLETSVTEASASAQEHSAGAAVRIVIADSGTGIASELRERIFNPFFTTKEKGSGLGLSIVHRIIDGLGGTIKVEERRPSGAAFIICLTVKAAGGGSDEDGTSS